MGRMHHTINVSTGEVTLVPYTAEEEASADVANITSAVPPAISPRQARLQLLQMDMLQTVETVISQQDEATKIAWEYSTEFTRNHPLLIQLAANLGLSSAQLDTFFIEASVL